MSKWFLVGSIVFSLVTKISTVGEPRVITPGWAALMTLETAFWVGGIIAWL